MKYLSILLLLGGLLFSSASYAGWSHGGDIKWEPLGNDSFKIVVTVYRDCNGINVGATNLQLYSNCGSQRASPKTLSSRDITPICSSISSSCSRKAPYYGQGIQETQMIYLVSMASWKKNGCCKVDLSWGSSNRTSAITTGGWNNGFYIHAEMSICGSPVTVNWIKEPKTIVCLGRDISLKTFSISTDSNSIDSVVYSWAEPLQSATRKTTWSSPYSYNKPVYFLGFPKEASKFPKGLHLDSNSGKLLLRPMKEETTILKVKASIYRNGVWQGSVYRDQIFMVVKCPNDNYPKLSSIDCKSSLVFPVDPSDVQKVICAGDSASFSICTSDKDKGDSVTLSYEHNIPGLTVTIDKSTATREKAVVSWQTKVSHIRDEPYRLIVRANDNACPIVGEDFQVYELYVKQAAEFKIDIKDLGCGNYEYTAMEKDSNALLGAYWIMNNRTVSNRSGVFSDTASYRHTSPGYSRFQFKASIDGFCPYTYEDSVLVKDNFLRVDIGIDSVFGCKGDSVSLSPKTFKAQGTVGYQWRDENDSLLSTAGIPKFQMRDSLLGLFVTANDGTCEASDHATLRPYINPEILLPKSAYACIGDSVNLSFTIDNQGQHDSITSFKWTDVTRSPILSDSATLNTRIEGKYLLEVSTLNNCSIFDSVTLSSYDPDFELTGDSTTCVDDNISFRASSSEFGDYRWFVGGQKLNDARLEKSGARISFKALTTERVRIRFTGAEHGLSCPKVKFIELQVHPKPVFNVTHPKALCQGDSILLRATDSTTWRMADRTVKDISVWYKAIDVGTSNKPYTTYLSATSLFGCSKDSSFDIQHNKTPDPSFVIPDSVFIETEFLGDNIGDYSDDNTYTWYVGNPAFATFTGYDPKIQIDVEGTFPVLMEAIDTITGCSAADSSSILVIDPSSIGRPTRNMAINVYPNPANRSFQIEWQGTQEFVWTLSNLHGQELMSGRVEGSDALISTENLSNGAYLIQTSNKGFIQSVLLQVSHP